MVGLSGFLFLFLSMATIGSAAELLRVVEGKSIVLRYPEKVETVSLADEEVADVVAITADELVIIGKEIGTTSLLVWGVSQRHTAYEVKVDRNFSGLQVLLEVQVGEVSSNKLSELGFDFTSLYEEESGDFQVQGGVYPGGTQAPASALTPQEGVSGFYRFDRFVGNKATITAAIHALQEQGDLKMLATPKLLSLSGQEASFLSGGEIPVPVPQSGAGFASYTIEWKEYGVRLNFVPTVVDSDLVNLNVSPEVSSLDWSNSVGVSGFQIPAMLTRRANTTVELNSGQTLFMGGLVASEGVKSVRRIPILGHIPLLGALFTRKDTSAKENELVFIVSPRIIGPASEEVTPPLPWDGKLEDEPADSSSTGENNLMDAPGGADR